MCGTLLSTMDLSEVCDHSSISNGKFKISLALTKIARECYHVLWYVTLSSGYLQGSILSYSLKCQRSCVTVSILDSGHPNLLTFPPSTWSSSCGNPLAVSQAWSTLETSSSPLALGMARHPPADPSPSAAYDKLPYHPWVSSTYEGSQ